MDYVTMATKNHCIYFFLQIFYFYLYVRFLERLLGISVGVCFHSVNVERRIDVRFDVHTLITSNLEDFEGHVATYTLPNDPSQSTSSD